MTNAVAAVEREGELTAKMASACARLYISSEKCTTVLLGLQGGSDRNRKG